MIHVKYKNQDYGIYWHYGFKINSVNKETHNSLTVKSTIVRTTNIVVENEHFIMSESVDCNPEDNFNKNIGRELTIEKLKERLSLDFVNAIKEAYLNRNKK